MSLMLSIPKSDLAKGIPVPHGWQTFLLTEVFSKPSSNGQSVNYIVVHRLKDDPDEREINHNFNSKALGMMAPFIAALAKKTVKEVLDGISTGALEFDLESVKGQVVLGKVEPEEYQGRVLSKIKDWAHPDNIPF